MTLVHLVYRPPLVFRQSATSTAVLIVKVVFSMTAIICNDMRCASGVPGGGRRSSNSTRCGTASIACGCGCWAPSRSCARDGGADQEPGLAGLAMSGYRARWCPTGAQRASGGRRAHGGTGHHRCGQDDWSCPAMSCWPTRRCASLGTNRPFQGPGHRPTQSACETPPPRGVSRSPPTGASGVRHQQHRWRPASIGGATPGGEFR